MSEQKSLLGVQSLVKFPEGSAILVQGQANFDAASRMFPQNPVLGWEGGTYDLKDYFLGHLATRNSIVWAANPLPQVVRHLIESLPWREDWDATRVKVVAPESVAECWSPAEAEAKGLKRHWLMKHLRPVTPRAPEGPPPMPETPREAPAINGAASATVTPITEARTRRQEKPAPAVDELPAKYSHDSLAAAFTATNPDWRHVGEWGRWLCWDGTYWKTDTVGAVKEAARQICRDAAYDARQRDIAASTLRTLLSVGTIDAVERIARSDPAHARTIDHWDADPWLLNTPGGVIDLRDGRQRVGRPEDHQTKITRATPGGDCPQWCQFLIDTTRGDGELIAFLQRAAGYWLTASIREHALFFFHGGGGNGKGTFLNTLTWILGDYAGIASMDMLTEQHNPQHLTFQAALKGRRLVVAQEVEEGKRWAEAKLASLTGGDPITANYMRHDPFTFEPTHKFAISGNHKPIFRNVGDAIRRRLHLIPFTNKPIAPDKELSDKLRAEAGGILRWAIAGCLLWQKTGLAPPEVVRAATSSYLASQDSLATWINECCDGDRELLGSILTPLKTLRDSYGGWCASAGEQELGRKRFVEAMESRGYEIVEQRKHYYIRGIRLRADDGAQGQFQD